MAHPLIGPEREIESTMPEMNNEVLSSKFGRTTCGRTLGKPVRGTRRSSFPPCDSVCHAFVTGAVRLGSLRSDDQTEVNFRRFKRPYDEFA